MNTEFGTYRIRGSDNRFSKRYRFSSRKALAFALLFGGFFKCCLASPGGGLIGRHDRLLAEIFVACRPNTGPGGKPVL